MNARPASEVDEMLLRIDERTKYNLLRANYMILAQSWHNLGISFGSHLGTRFQECKDVTCKELVRALDLTKLR
jgi:hypothetical protein